MPIKTFAAYIEECTAPYPYTDDELITEILHWYLMEGCRSAKTISTRMKRPDLIDRVHVLMRDPRCTQEIKRARREIVAFTLDQMRKNLPTYFKEMHALATDADNTDTGHVADKRVKYSALSKMFDATGVTSATMKGAGTTPKAYRDAVKELMPDDDEDDGDGE